MEIREIKETREVLVRVEYIAGDGVKFYNEDECNKYEESALFAVSKKLKRLHSKPLSHFMINDECSDENTVEIFDIQTDKDLENLRQYLYLKMKKNGATDNSINECFGTKTETRKDYVFSNVTPGHEVIIFWNYDTDWFWVYRDGSINGYVEFFRDKINSLIDTESSTKTMED